MLGGAPCSHSQATTRLDHLFSHPAFRLFLLRLDSALLGLQLPLDDPAKLYARPVRDNVHQRILAQFVQARLLRLADVLVLNIRGNDYRLGVVYVKFIGTHSEYDKIDADTVDME